MNAFWACFLPLAYTLAVLFVGWWVGRHGSPVKWVGFRRRQTGAVRVEAVFDE
jgi:hypothetical protein